MKLQLLQVLRGFAATMVVLFHAQGLAAAYAEAPSLSGQIMGSSGGYGVDLFFVLSGFIIRYTEPLEGYLPGPFLRRRVARIVPLYWLSMLAVIALRWTVPHLHNGPPPAFDLLLRSLIFAAFTDARFPLVYVGWSLEYEMVFYVTSALLIAWTANPWRWLVVAFSLLGATGSLAHPDSLSPTLTFLSNPIVLEFALGAQLASTLRTRRLDLWPIGFLGLALVVVAASGSALGIRVLVAGVPSTALVATCAQLELNRPNLAVPGILVRLGDASYSIYLGQVFLVSATGKVVLRVLPAIQADLLVLLATLFSCVGGLLAYYCVERPLTRVATRWVTGRARPKQTAPVS